MYFDIVTLRLLLEHGVLRRNFDQIMVKFLFCDLRFDLILSLVWWLKTGYVHVELEAIVNGLCL